MTPEDWARERKVQFIAQEALAGATDFPGSYGIDFGRLERRVPAFVLRPRSVDDLADCLCFLGAERLSYKLRGTAHTPGGEVLTESAVIDLTELTGIVADDPMTDEITVLGGTSWLAMWEHLQAQGRRPQTLTEHPRVTVAGSLTVGGIGDSSHLHGPQVAGVRRLLLVTPDGERHDVRPGHPLFDHALCGHGQLGALAEVTLASWRRPAILTGVILEWDTLEAFLRDALLIMAERLYDYLRPRLRWRVGNRVSAICGNLDETMWTTDPARHRLRPAAASHIEQVDILKAARQEVAGRFAAFGPCAEVVLPYPDGLETLRTLDRAVVTTGLWRRLPRGSALMLVGGTSGLPLSPFQAPRCLVLALRPEPTTLADAHACQALVRELAELALAGGGRLYLSSFPLRGDALERQLGDGARSLAALKTAVDPALLCNRGNLYGWEP